MRDVLLRNGHPHRGCEADSAEGQHVLRLAGCSPDALPVVVFPNGKALVQPSRTELAAVLGVRSTPTRPEYEVAIVGAGPAGLSAATYAASEGLTHATDRAGRHRRPGRVELPDPQLPRLPTRHQRA